MRREFVDLFLYMMKQDFVRIPEFRYVIFESNGNAVYPELIDFFLQFLSLGFRITDGVELKLIETTAQCAVKRFDKGPVYILYGHDNLPGNSVMDQAVGLFHVFDP